MAQQTLLNIVQNILSAMSSDEVNSISDTVESLQVAQIVQNKYYDIVARGDLTLDNHLFQLNSSIDPTVPVMLMLPPGVSRIDWLMYLDTNPSDGTQDDQFGAFSPHDINLDLVSTTDNSTILAPTINWVTQSVTPQQIPNIPVGTMSFAVTSSSLPIVVGQTMQGSVQSGDGEGSFTGIVQSYSGTTLTVNVTSVANPGLFAAWDLVSFSFPNVIPGYKHIDIVTNEVFIEEINRIDLSQTGAFGYTFRGIAGQTAPIQNVNGPGINASFQFRGWNDRQPRMCSVFSNVGNVSLNYFVLFDAFDSTQDSALQGKKSMAMGQIIPAFSLEDNFVPILDDLQFSLLLNESKSLAFYELKQMPHAKADQEIQRQWAVTQARKSKSNKPSYFDQLSDYGRQPRTGGQSGYPLYYRFMRNY